MSNYLPSSYEEFLEDGLTLDGLKQLLETDSSWVNKVNSCQEPPLFIVLRNEKCSPDIVELLLQYTSNINCLNSIGESCLSVALSSWQHEAIIKVLLDNGADVNTLDRDKRSPLCVAFRCDSSMQVVKLLLDAKCPPKACGMHESLVNCFLDSMYAEGLTEDCLELLFAAGGDLNSVDRNGRSLICHALQCSLMDPQYIELLLSRGCSLNACKKHDSPILCCVHGYDLRTDVVQLLLKKKAAMDKKCSCGTALQLALLRTRHDYKAIKLMVDHSSFDVNASLENYGNLLHVAIENYHCQVSVLQLLIDLGVRVDGKNRNGETVMEAALRSGHDCHVLQLLYVAGFSIDLSINIVKISFLQFSLNEYKFEPSQKNLDRFKLLLKCFCLENLDFHIQGLPLNHCEDSQILRYADECRKEVQRMKLQTLFRYHTLQDFARRPYTSQKPSNNFIATMKSYELSQLLRILSDNLFPIYFDIIVAKIGRMWMKEKLKEVSVYTINISCAERNVLNYECVLHLTQYLADEDLIQLIIAFFCRFNFLLFKCHPL